MSSPVSYSKIYDNMGFQNTNWPRSIVSENLVWDMGTGCWGNLSYGKPVHTKKKSKSKKRRNTKKRRKSKKKRSVKRSYKKKK